MAEELDLHLLEFARAEGEVPRRDLVAKALADLGDAERDPHARAVENVLEVDEDALGGFRPQKRLAGFVAGHGADVGLEHQVEFAGLGERAQGFRVRPQNAGSVLNRGQRQEFPFPVQLLGVLGTQVEELQARASTSSCS
jgi:hypothetical protein